MREFLDKVKSSVGHFMAGRYGSDQLGLTLVVAGFILSLLAQFAGRWLSVVALALVVVAVVRMLSKDRASRAKENQAFLMLLAKPRAWFRRQQTKWKNRDTKAYVRCPHCHGEFALPKGKGHLRATCPHCGEKSEHTV